ncbi:MAG: hypothetical protein IJM79_08660 [Erysipelotrichaceae bacterium]|nr:hypothetical protein [Erysipelotrichaceae bacterium]
MKAVNATNKKGKQSNETARIHMDKKSLMENFARKAHEKGSFNGVWLYAENGEIVS